MKKLIFAVSFISNSLLAGVVGGGSTPPALQAPDELMLMSVEGFKNLSLDVIQNADMPINVNGKAAKPLIIDIQSKTIRFESIVDKKIIDVSIDASPL